MRLGGQQKWFPSHRTLCVYSPVLYARTVRPHSTIRSEPMKVHSANTNIKATPDKIWTILTDGPNYPKWDPWATRIEGNIVAGGKVTAYTKLSPDRAFPVKVSEFEPGRKMTWTGGMP